MVFSVLELDIWYITFFLERNFYLVSYGRLDRSSPDTQHMDRYWKRQAKIGLVGTQTQPRSATANDASAASVGSALTNATDVSSR